MTKHAIVCLHPIHYQTPIWQALDEEVDGVEVIYLDRMGFDEFKVKELNYVYHLDRSHFVGYRFKLLTNFSFHRITGFFSRVNLDVFFVIISNRYKTVLLHGYSTCSMWIALFAAKICGSKVVFRGEGFEKKKTSKLKNLLIKIFLSQCDVLCFSCEQNKKKFLPYLNSSCELLPVYSAVDQRLIAEVKAKKKMKLARHDIVTITMVGRLTDRKRPLEILRAISHVDNAAFNIIFVGDGPKRREILDLAENLGISVTVTGFLNNINAMHYTNSADVFCCISSYDASPKALNEAVLLDKFCIVSNGVGTRDLLIVHQRNGFHVDEDHQLDDALRFLLKNKKTIKQGHFFSPSRDLVTTKQTAKVLARAFS